MYRSCPTNALATPYQMDATKCIYATIELKNNIPDSFKDMKYFDVTFKTFIHGIDFQKTTTSPFEDKKI